MHSRRLITIGNSIINNRKRDGSTINSSSILDRSIGTNYTHETPRKITSSYSLTKKEPISKDRLTTDINVLSTKNNNSQRKSNNINLNLKLMNYINTEPNVESKPLISHADKILKERKNNHLMMNFLVKSVFMKKTNENCLNNFRIKLLKNKRRDISNKISDISSAIKSSEKIFDQDYQTFLEFVEKNNNSHKRQESILNRFKRMLDEKEVEFNKENLKNKRLISEIEFLVRKIITLNHYGSFIHNVFKIDYVFANIQKTDGKSFLNVAEDIIKEYQKKEEQKEFDKKLLDEYWLMAQFNEFEQKIIQLLNQGEEYKKDLLKKGSEDDVEIIRLTKKKEEYEKLLKIATIENHNFMKSLTTYTPPEEMDYVLDYICEFAELFEFNNNPSLSLLMKDKNIASYSSLSLNLVSIIREKECVLNDYIAEIEKVLNGDNEDDKLLIEEIISERKRQIKKEKLNEALKEQEELLKIKNKKAVEKAQRIVIKGRKVIDLPIVKSKKKIEQIIIEGNEDEYLNYSSDES